ncbi:MAG: sulfite exporter TauE/SafE family protein [Candidatus Marinimicrobia bacterium]|jgi:hypothetical protein|nr:sulfite exporter TauE/SafE family protein [Candidatus Neomarinimicrobiota bacterium]
MEYLLPILFLFVAFIYSSVGLGGGSSYTALMAIFGIAFPFIPTTSLMLNLLVSFIGIINFWRNGHGNLKLILPFLITSIPMTFIAGTIVLPELIFQIFLLITLIFVALRIYVVGELKLTLQLSSTQKWIFTLGLGAVLGFIAGALGIGGGIYLVPFLVMTGLASQKEASASGVLFIWVNSLTGLIARTQAGTFNAQLILPLAGAVGVGGFFGSWFGSTKFSPHTIQKIMGGVIIIAIVFLLRKIL